MPKNVDDLRDVIAAYKSVDVAIEMARPFPDFLTMSPHYSGHGVMIWGIDAYRKLRAIAEKSLAKSEHAGKVKLDSVFETLIAEISERFLKDKKPLSEREADRAIAAALKKAAMGIKVLTHLIPCRVAPGDKPATFSIGPVTFSRWKEKEPDLEAYTKRYIAEATADDNAAKREDLVLILLRYFKSFDWVAEVTIEASEPDISRERAEMVVQGAIDCLQVLLGARSTRYMKAGGVVPQIDRRGRITIGAAGNVEVSAFVSWPENNLGEEWWEFLNEDERRPLVELFGVALTCGRWAAKPTPLAQRIMDAIAWYGDATRDNFQASRLVKYVTAIERILVTKHEDELADTIARHGSALMIAWGEKDIVKIRKSLKSVYNARSQLVHGSKSPLDARLWKMVREAEKFSRLTILCAARQFDTRGLTHPSYKDDELGAFFERLAAFVEANEASASGGSGPME